MTDVSTIYIMNNDRDGQFPTNWRMVSKEAHGGVGIPVKGVVEPGSTCWLVVAEETHYDSEDRNGGFCDILGAFITSADAVRLVEMYKEAFIARQKWVEETNSTPRKPQKWFHENPKPETFTGPDGATYSIAQWGWGTALDNMHVIPVQYSEEIKTFDGWWKYTS